MENTNDVATGIENANEVSEVQEVSPETSAATEQDGRKNRKKKRVYPVPAEKLQYPFQAGVPEFTLEYSKLTEDDFVDSESFDRWECEVYLELRIQNIRLKAEKVLKPLQQQQEAIRIKLEQSKEICEALQIDDESQKAAIADSLAMLSSAEATGISMEQMLDAMKMLAAAKEAANDS